MELERNTVNTLIQHLKNLGFPESSFATEYQIGKYRIDLAIIDPKIKMPIQIFEVKYKDMPETRKSGKNQLELYLNTLGIDIPAYLVFLKNGSLCFLRYDRKKNDFEEAEYINYDYQRQSVEAQIIVNSQRYKRKNSFWYKMICISIAFVLLVVFILVKAGVIKWVFSLYDMIFIGIIIILFISPFTKSLKIGDYFEMILEQKDEKK